MKVTENPLMSKVAERIHAARESTGLTQQALVSRLNASEQAPQKELKLDTFKKWEYGTNQLNIEWLPALCDVLHCDVGYLFGEYPQFRRVNADICKETGLTENAVNAIRSYRATNRADWGLDAINALIESKDFLSLICYMVQYATSNGKQAEIVFSGDTPPQTIDCQAVFLSNIQDTINLIAHEMSDKFGGKTDNRVFYKFLLQAEEKGLVTPLQSKEIADRIERGDYSDFAT